MTGTADDACIEAESALPFRPPRVLLAAMEAGGGHIALRDALWTALRRVDPDGQRFELCPWTSESRLINRLYAFIVHRVPRVQGTIFELGDRDWGVQLSAAGARHLVSEAVHTLLSRRPDVVVTTHWLLGLVFARARTRLRLPVTLVSAIPDYGAPVRALCPAQVALRADYFIAMEEETGARLTDEHGVPPERIALGGFLPRPAFARLGRRIGDGVRLPSRDRERMLDRLTRRHPILARLVPGRLLLLFLGGSAWTSRTMPVLERLLRDPALRERVNVVVVCGRDEPFRRRLLQRVGEWPAISVFGHVGPGMLARLMALADLPVLGSLAPATMQELLEVRCGPLLVHAVIPGTEPPHVRYVEANGLGLYEPTPERALDVLRQAAALVPPSAGFTALQRGFPRRAAMVRRLNEQRARDLGPFLEEVMRRPRRERTPLRSRNVSRWANRVRIG